MFQRHYIVIKQAKSSKKSFNYFTIKKKSQKYFRRMLLINTPYLQIRASPILQKYLTISQTTTKQMKNVKFYAYKKV